MAIPVLPVVWSSLLFVLFVLPLYNQSSNHTPSICGSKKYSRKHIDDAPVLVDRKLDN